MRLESGRRGKKEELVDTNAVWSHEEMLSGWRTEQGIVSNDMSTPELEPLKPFNFH